RVALACALDAQARLLALAARQARAADLERHAALETRQDLRDQQRRVVGAEVATRTAQLAALALREVCVAARPQHARAQQHAVAPGALEALGRLEREREAVAAVLEKCTRQCGLRRRGQRPAVEAQLGAARQ